MKGIKSSDFNKIIEIIVGEKGVLRDKYFLAELFLQSGFDRSTVKFLLNFSQTEIEFTTEILRKYYQHDDFLRLLQNISENLLSENENDTTKLHDIILQYIESPDDNTMKAKEKENPALRMTDFLHEEVKGIFASGIKIKKYDGLVFECFHLINEKLNKYCLNVGLGSCKEGTAIDEIFTSEKNPFRFDVLTDDGKSQKEGLQHLFHGLIKFYRNPLAHGKYIKSEREFIEAITLLSMLLHKIDDSDIGKQKKKQNGE